MKNYFEEIGAWPHSHGIARAYVAGFVLSLALTLGAYVLVAQHALPQVRLVAAIVAAALVQFIVQVVCFLHLGRGSASRKRLVIFGFAILVVGILVSGSLWIMFSLNLRMMPDASQMEQYMQSQGGF
ncbi:MAG TPA: cytochrome o ubiquinol oxidase subunit IV [Candidatus Paceibacterota bacterium]|nr:cytochrome o ubiquinol oxidase subunit IV [Candidatus Paceibacterota bacterium]